jgi:hypothetical protein
MKLGLEKFFDFVAEIFSPSKTWQERINKKYVGKVFRPSMGCSEIMADYLNIHGYGNAMLYRCSLKEDCEYKRNFEKDIEKSDWGIWGCSLGKKGCIFKENYSSKNNMGTLSIDC